MGISVGGAGPGAPAILMAGTEEQKKYFIPGLITGDIIFAQGYTEPQGGADLAGLQCRAVRDGDEYVINGQKMYTSSAHYATHIYLMCRTDPDAPRHRGISILLVPMDTPGITVRALWTIQSDPPAPLATTYGMPRTNEVFFEDVRVPASTWLGEENMGWYVGAMGLNLEPGGSQQVPDFGSQGRGALSTGSNTTTSTAAPSPMIRPSEIGWPSSGSRPKSAG